jgi:hypothetical protein
MSQQVTINYYLYEQLFPIDAGEAAVVARHLAVAPRRGIAGKYFQGESNIHERTRSSH